MLLCPICHEPLHRVEMTDFHADECRLCDGLWLEDGQPEALVCLSVMPQNMLQPIYFERNRDENAVDPLRCPSCQVNLQVWRIKEIIPVDVCPECRGLWLDRWELQKILKD